MKKSIFVEARPDNLIGVNAGGKEVSGTITIPEAAHDTDEDEYVVRSLTLYLYG